MAVSKPFDCAACGCQTLHMPKDWVRGQSNWSMCEQCDKRNAEPSEYASPRLAHARICMKASHVDNTFTVIVDD